MRKQSEYEIALNERFAARQRLVQMVTDFTESTTVDGEADNDNYVIHARRDTELLESLIPVVRAHLATLPGFDAFVKFEADEAEAMAEHDANNLARAKAAGFDSYDAWREAVGKAQRSETAKKAAATRKRRAEGGPWFAPDDNSMNAVISRLGRQSEADAETEEDYATA